MDETVMDCVKSIALLKAKKGVLADTIMKVIMRC